MNLQCFDFVHFSSNRTNRLLPRSDTLMQETLYLNEEYCNDEARKDIKHHTKQSNEKVSRNSSSKNHYITSCGGGLSVAIY